MSYRYSAGFDAPAYLRARLIVCGWSVDRGRSEPIGSRWREPPHGPTPQSDNHSFTVALCAVGDGPRAGHAVGPGHVVRPASGSRSRSRSTRTRITEAEVRHLALTAAAAAAGRRRPERQAKTAAPRRRRSRSTTPDPFHKDDSGEQDGHGSANRSAPRPGSRCSPSAAYEQADLDPRTKVTDPTLVDPSAPSRRPRPAGVTPDDAVPIAAGRPAQRGTYQPGPGRPQRRGDGRRDADPAGALPTPSGASCVASADARHRRCQLRPTTPPRRRRPAASARRSPSAVPGLCPPPPPSREPGPWPAVATASDTESPAVRQGHHGQLPRRPHPRAGRG